MLLLLFAACRNDTEDPDRPPEASEDAHGPDDSNTRTSGVSDDQTTAEVHPPCSHRTDHREGTGSGTIVISLELEKEGIFTLRPVESFSWEDTGTTSSTQVLGYNPRASAEFLVGEDAVLYYCDVDYWIYLGDLDMDRVLDSHANGTYKITRRNYHEDGTPRENTQVDFRLRVRELVFRQ